MLRLRRLGVLAAAGAVAAGLAMVAPSRVVAATGCGGSFTLASGQSAQCIFLYSGPNAAGEYNDSAFANVTGGGPAVFGGGLQSAGGTIIDQCFGVSLVNTGGCGQTENGHTTPPVPVGTTVICHVDNFGPATITGNYSCASGF